MKPVEAHKHMGAKSGFMMKNRGPVVNTCQREVDDVPPNRKVEDQILTNLSFSKYFIQECRIYKNQTQEHEHVHSLHLHLTAAIVK